MCPGYFDLTKGYCRLRIEEAVWYMDLYEKYKVPELLTWAEKQIETAEELTRHNEVQHEVREPRKRLDSYKKTLGEVYLNVGKELIKDFCSCKDIHTIPEFFKIAKGYGVDTSETEKEYDYFFDLLKKTKPKKNKR